MPFRKPEKGAGSTCLAVGWSDKGAYGIVGLSEMFSQRTNWKLTPNLFTQTADELRARGVCLTDLTISNPTECGFHYDSGAILGAFQNPKSLTYEPEAKGLLRAREEVARYYSEEHGETIDPDSLVLTTSTSEAYSYVFRLLCNPHDEVLVPKPSYPLFDFLADLQDVTLIPYMLHYAHGWFVDIESVLRALTPRTRAILLVHPNNPTGSYVKREELARLNELCRERHLALIVDEVFLDYSLDGHTRKSCVGNRDTLTFTLSGLSKIAALPQMKVAWLATSGPHSLARPALDRLEIIADTYLSLSSPAQWAFPSLFEQRRSLQPQISERTKDNYNCLRSLLAGHASIELLVTEGGWYGVLRITCDKSDEELVIEIMRRAHVLVHPGHFYDFPSDDYLVVSLIVHPDELSRGISAVKEVLS